MSWILRLVSKARNIDMTDVMNQQAVDELLAIFRELIG